AGSPGAAARGEGPTVASAFRVHLRRCAAGYRGSALTTRRRDVCPGGVP
ncbi:MAG: hypothetical protein AVDCRST_MAG37-3191, partial [uncultured Rubrobacteraceae bacterium]